MLFQFRGFFSYLDERDRTLLVEGFSDVTADILELIFEEAVGNENVVESVCMDSSDRRATLVVATTKGNHVFGWHPNYCFIPCSSMVKFWPDEHMASCGIRRPSVTRPASLNVVGYDS